MLNILINTSLIVVAILSLFKSFGCILIYISQGIDENLVHAGKEPQFDRFTKKVKHLNIRMLASLVVFVFCIVTLFS